MKTMRALASNGFHSGSSSSKQCISSRLVHFKGTMRDDITSAVHCSDIMAHGVYLRNIHRLKTRCTRLRCPRLDCPPAC